MPDMCRNTVWPRKCNWPFVVALTSVVGTTCDACIDAVAALCARSFVTVIHSVVYMFGMCWRHQHMQLTATHAIFQVPNHLAYTAGTADTLTNTVFTLSW